VLIEATFSQSGKLVCIRGDIVVLEYYTNVIHDNRVYKLDHVEKCCDDIINKIGKGFSIEENDNGIDIGLYVSDYETFYYKMEYCPFCGEKIESKELSIADFTEKYQEIQKKLEWLSVGDEGFQELQEELRDISLSEL